MELLIILSRKYIFRPNLNNIFMFKYILTKKSFCKSINTLGIKQFFFYLFRLIIIMFYFQNLKI